MKSINGNGDDGDDDDGGDDVQRHSAYSGKNF